jgi:hypothetical protein
MSAPPPPSSPAAAVAAAVAGAARARIPVRARGGHDKEFGVQDWVETALRTSDATITPSPRNTHPDLWYADGTGRVAVEVKSLEERADGRACRRDIDFNSTAPTQTVDGDRCLLTFVTSRPVAGERHVGTVCVADMAVISDAAPDAPNSSLVGAGSWGDGRIRNRRMYVFDHPVTLCASYNIDIRGYLSAIFDSTTIDTGTQTLLEQHDFEPVGTITRRAPDLIVVSYSVSCEDGTLTAHHAPNPRAGATSEFVVWRSTERHSPDPWQQLTLL